MQMKKVVKCNKPHIPCGLPQKYTGKKQYYEVYQSEEAIG